MKEESLTSSVQEFVREDSLDGTKRLDFVAYRRAQRQRQLMEAINRKDSIKIVGRRIEKPSENYIRAISYFLLLFLKFVC